jgi:hypothetical protein
VPACFEYQKSLKTKRWLPNKLQKASRARLVFFQAGHILFDLPLVGAVDGHWISRVLLGLEIIISAPALALESSP